MQIYRSFNIGDLASVWVLDTRQYRSDQVCDDEPGPICAEIEQPDRTLLGADQKQWLMTNLQASTQLWNIVAQQVPFNPLEFFNSLLYPDHWDGYPVERQELLDLFATLGNVLVLSGDIHAGGFAELKVDASNQSSQTIAYEVISPSITSGGDLDLEAITDLILQQNPQIQHLNASDRGYVICEIGRDKRQVPNCLPYREQRSRCRNNRIYRRRIRSRSHQSAASSFVTIKTIQTLHSSQGQAVNILVDQRDSPSSKHTFAA